MPLTLDDYVVQIPEKPVWYKRTSFLLLVAACVVVLASVLVDLPSKVTPATDAAAQTTVLREINSDIAGCAFAAKETFTIYQDFHAKTLTAQDRSLAPSMLRDDQVACSLTSSSIYDLSNIEPTGSAAGKRIGDIARIGVLWSSSDAQQAIIAVHEIVSGKLTRANLKSLTQAEARLDRDRAAVLADMSLAEADVHAKLPAPDFPALSRLPGT